MLVTTIIKFIVTVLTFYVIYSYFKIQLTPENSLALILLLYSGVEYIGNILSLNSKLILLLCLILVLNNKKK